MTDVLIIGSGPAGMTAAIYAKRANLDVLVVEKEYEGTGQMAESSRIDNYPGFYGSNGYELGEKIREHVEALGVAFFRVEASSEVSFPSSQSELRLPLLQVVSSNKYFSVGVQSPTEINAPRGCAVILIRFFR